MVSKYFKIHELVDRETYEERGELGWELIDPRLIVVIDRLKEKFNRGSISINTYHWGGNRNWSGLRTLESPYYSKYSQHSFGRAIDCVFSEYSTEEVREYLIKNQDSFSDIRGIEVAEWLHLDLRNTTDDKLKVFKP